MELSTLFATWLANLATDPWPLVMPLSGIVVLAMLYWRGMRYQSRLAIGRGVTLLQTTAFTAGLLAILLAVASPMDVLADQSLAAHMVQHELLVLVAPPLLLLGEPLWPLWRALPLGWRRALLRWAIRRHWPRSAGEAIARVAHHPIGAWSLFVGVFLVWHIPALYDLALRSEAVHALEHSTFIMTALIFWAQVIPSFPIQPALSHLKRAGYLFVAALVLHLVSIFISVAVRPIYLYYGSSLDAIANQTAAGALMDVSGQIVFTIAILVCLWFWLRDDEHASQLQGEGGAPESALTLRASGALLLAEAEGADASVGDPRATE